MIQICSKRKTGCALTSNVFHKQFLNVHIKGLSEENVSVCVCVCVCVYVSMYVSMYVCVCVCMYVCR